MILIEAGPDNERGFDAKILFAAQLEVRGHHVVIDEDSLPEGLRRNQKYEVAPYLVNLDDVSIDRVILIGAEDISDATLIRLRGVGVAKAVAVSAVGRFAGHPAFIAAQTRLAYALGREAQIINLAEVQKVPLPVVSASPLVATAQSAPMSRDMPPALFLFLPPEWLEEPANLSLLGAMNNLPDFRLNVLVAGRGKEIIRESRYATISAYGYAELGPGILSQQADIAVFFGENVPGERMAAFATELMAKGKTVIDATSSAAFVTTGAPVLRGPEDLAALPHYLRHVVLVNLPEIGRQTQINPWVTSRSIESMERMLGIAGKVQRGIAKGDAESDGRTIFLPTNGNGLGHAQRCALIAAEIDAAQKIGFAAFPSCVPLIHGKGFACLPLVSKSDDHGEEFANDIVNYVRLRRFLGPRDHLVFDGGYIFDSIFRSILEKGCRATWVRRGLLRPDQINDIQKERERAFGTIIVPNEAFEELNTPYSTGPEIRDVGPIVQRAGAANADDIRARIAQHFDVEFDTLVVSMLGGGVAADRTAQLQSLCATFEQRPRCLHLVVVWPNSRVAPVLYGWRKSRIVQTRSSLDLCLAADLVVSAAGYNSFHELIYHGVPTIFIPQIAPYMDDQERRARAASDRGLAETVLAHELVQLDRAIVGLLDGARRGEILKAFAETELPEPGNGTAAKLIQTGAES